MREKRSYNPYTEQIAEISTQINRLEQELQQLIRERMGLEIRAFQRPVVVFPDTPAFHLLEQ